MTSRTRPFMLLTSLACLGAPALAQNEAAAPSAFSLTAETWRFEFNTWIWAMGVEGDIGVRGRSADISADFLDILDNSDSIFAFSGRLELGYGKIAGFVDGMYADLGVDDASGPAGVTDFDVEFEQTIIDFGLMYRIGEWEPSGDAANNRRNITLDPYAGARYSALELTIDPSRVNERSGDEDWIDPIVGAKFVLPVAESWHFELNGDVGGFGVSSDFTWSATAVVGYDFHLFDLPASVKFGYRAIGWDYTADDSREFKWDIVQHGLILGFSLFF